ncbi:hypothetical protein YB2330_006204 [Saitoella coloradoensis]
MSCRRDVPLSVIQREAVTALGVAVNMSDDIHRLLDQAITGLALSHFHETAYDKENFERSRQAKVMFTLVISLFKQCRHFTVEQIEKLSPEADFQHLINVLTKLTGNVFHLHKLNDTLTLSTGEAISLKTYNLWDMVVTGIFEEHVRMVPLYRSLHDRSRASSIPLVQMVAVHMSTTLSTFEDLESKIRPIPVANGIVTFRSAHEDWRLCVKRPYGKVTIHKSSTRNPTESLFLLPVPIHLNPTPPNSPTASYHPPSTIKFGDCVQVKHPAEEDILLPSHDNYHSIFRIIHVDEPYRHCERPIVEGDRMFLKTRSGKYVRWKWFGSGIELSENLDDQAVWVVKADGMEPIKTSPGSSAGSSRRGSIFGRTKEEERERRRTISPTMTGLQRVASSRSLLEKFPALGRDRRGTI